MVTVTFDFFNLRDYVDKITDIRRQVLPSRDHTFVDVPGKAGALIARSKSGVKTIEVDVQIYGTTKAAIRTKVDALAGVLFTEEPATLTFSDEPTKTYYAIVSSETPFEELARLGRSTIKFVCPDPYATGALKTFTSTNKAVVNFTNAGNAPALPKFTATFAAAATYFEVQLNQAKKIRVDYAFTAGTVLVIDHKENLVTINGTVNNQTIWIESDFFFINPGSNRIDILSTDAGVDTVMTYNERWL